MGAKAEIGWKRTTEDGVRLDLYAQHVGGDWHFFYRTQRYEQWQPMANPPVEDWRELLDAVRRRIQRRLLRPEEELRVLKTMKQRFPGETF